jgi:long-subunit acyl-CoA synthetase (AMP-forming)
VNPLAQTTVDALFRAYISRRPTGVMFVEAAGERVTNTTRQDVMQRVASIADDLITAGFGAGDRLLTFVEAMRAAIELQLACAHLGVVTVPLASNASSVAIRECQRASGAKAIVATGRARSRLLSRGFSVLPVGALSGRGYRVMDPDRSYHLLADLGAGRSPADLYMIQPTSGSTGEPKLVPRTQAAFTRSAWIGSLVLDAAPSGERWLMSAPLTHGMGHSDLATALHVNAEMAIPSSTGVELRLDEVRRLGPTGWTAPMRVVRSLWRQHLEQGAAGALCPTLRTLIVGGSQADPKILEQIAEQGVAVIDCYGASECGLISQTERGQWRPGSVGVPLPDVTLRFDPDGELLVKTPALTSGYLDRSAWAEVFTADGFYRTGDHLRREGRELIYVGRVRDLFNTADGTNIHPAWIEEALERLPGFSQVMLVGDGLPFISAFVVSDRPDDELIAEVSRFNATIEAPSRIKMVVRLKRPFPAEVHAPTESGKIRRARPRFLELYAAEIGSVYDGTSDEALLAKTSQADWARPTLEPAG